MMRAAIAMLVLLAGPAAAQVTQVRPTVIAPAQMYFACVLVTAESKTQTVGPCVAAGPTAADYEKIAQAIIKQQTAPKNGKVEVFALIK